MIRQKRLSTDPVSCSVRRLSTHENARTPSLRLPLGRSLASARMTTRGAVFLLTIALSAGLIAGCGEDAQPPSDEEQVARVYNEMIGIIVR